MSFRPLESWSGTLPTFLTSSARRVAFVTHPDKLPLFAPETVAKLDDRARAERHRDAMNVIESFRTGVFAKEWGKPPQANAGDVIGNILDRVASEWTIVATATALAKQAAEGIALTAMQGGVFNKFPTYRPISCMNENKRVGPFGMVTGTTFETVRLSSKMKCEYVYPPLDNEPGLIPAAGLVNFKKPGSKGCIVAPRWKPEKSPTLPQGVRNPSSAGIGVGPKSWLFAFVDRANALFELDGSGHQISCLQGGFLTWLKRAASAEAEIVKGATETGVNQSIAWLAHGFLFCGPFTAEIQKYLTEDLEIPWDWLIALNVPVARSPEGSGLYFYDQSAGDREGAVTAPKAKDVAGAIGAGEHGLRFPGHWYPAVRDESFRHMARHGLVLGGAWLGQIVHNSSAIQSLPAQIDHLCYMDTPELKNWTYKNHPKWTVETLTDADTWKQCIEAVTKFIGNFELSAIPAPEGKGCGGRIVSRETCVIVAMGTELFASPYGDGYLNPETLRLRLTTLQKLLAGFSNIVVLMPLRSEKMMDHELDPNRYYDALYEQYRASWSAMGATVVTSQQLDEVRAALAGAMINPNNKDEKFRTYCLSGDGSKTTFGLLQYHQDRIVQLMALLAYSNGVPGDIQVAMDAYASNVLRNLLSLIHI